MSEPEGVGRGADSPRRRARAAAEAAGQSWARDDAAQPPRASGSSYGLGYSPGDGYTASGYSANGYSASGYQENGYSANGYPENGYSASGYPASGYQENGYSASGSATSNGYLSNGSAPSNGSGQLSSNDYRPTNGNQHPHGYVSNGYSSGGPAPTAGSAPYDPAAGQQAGYGSSNGASGQQAYGASGQQAYGASGQQAYGAGASGGVGISVSSPYAQSAAEQSPYAVSAPVGGGSPYTVSSVATTTRSPYEDVIRAPAEALAPPVARPQVAPPSPLNGSALHGASLGHRQEVSEEPSTEPWTGRSREPAPPRRRTSGLGTLPDLDGRDVGRDGRRAPAGRVADRSRPGRPGRSTDVLSRVTERTGLGRGGSVRESRGRSEPATPLQAAASAGTEIVVVLGMALALSLLIKTFLVQAFFIPSQSMQDTLQVGDRVLVSKLTPGPFSLHRGDIVVFRDPGGWLPPQPEQPQSPIRHVLTSALTFIGLLPQDSGEHLIKRVIGLPGDTVTCCDAQGRILVNGTPVDEPYVRANNKPSEKQFDVTIAPDRIWVLGDNRSQSWDSRFHQDRDNGQVPMENVVGKAFVTVWPFTRAGGLGRPTQVFAPVPDAAPAGAG